MDEKIAVLCSCIEYLVAAVRNDIIEMTEYLHLLLYSKGRAKKNSLPNLYYS